MKSRFLFSLVVPAMMGRALPAQDSKETKAAPRAAVNKRVNDLEQSLQKLRLVKAQAVQPGAGSNLQQRVNDLEQIVKQLLDEIAQLKEQVTTTKPEPSPTALNPQIGIIADSTGRLLRGDRFIAGVHPNGNTFALREAELSLQSVIDPFGRLDVFASFGPEGAKVEEAYATITNARILRLPRNITLRLGKMRPAFGKINLTHQPELPFIDYPMPLKNFFGDEAFAGSTGAEFNYLLPMRPFTELRVAAFSPSDESVAFDSAGAGFRRLLTVGQLRTFFDLNESSNLDLGLSLAHGANATGKDSQVAGAHLVYRWRPPRRGKYDSLTFWNEVFLSNRHELVDDGTGTLVSTRYRKTGLFSYLEKQLDRRWFLGAMYERSQFPNVDGKEQAYSMFATFFPSEFSKYRVGVRRKQHSIGLWTNEFFLQTTFNIGAHGRHPF